MGPAQIARREAFRADKHETEHKSLDSPDQKREFPHGRAEILKIRGGEVGGLVFELGWRWSNHVKPIARTDSYEAPQFHYAKSS